MIIKEEPIETVVTSDRCLFLGINACSLKCPSRTYHTHAQALHKTEASSYYQNTLHRRCHRICDNDVSFS
eukprot:m.78447 g.78447  ORF g.78447 m.78447 type:complete len:70 (+) comp11955_c2_seq5:96-305(+)